MKYHSLLITWAFILVTGCARYEITKQQDGKDRLGDGKNFTGEPCTESIEEPAVVCRSADGTFTISATPRQTVPGGIVNFTGICAGAPVLNWNFGDGTSAATANPAHKYAQPGTFIASATCDIQGQRRSGTLTILVRDNSNGGGFPGNNPGQNPAQNPNQN